MYLNNILFQKMFFLPDMVLSEKILPQPFRRIYDHFCVNLTCLTCLTIKGTKLLQSVAPPPTPSELLFVSGIDILVVRSLVYKAGMSYECRTFRKTIRLLMCQIANIRNFSGIWRSCPNSLLRIFQIALLDGLAILSDPEEVDRVGPTPHTTCY